jgi:hypothetical protein
MGERMPQPEKRKSSRKDVKVDAQLRFADGKTLSGVCQNISSGSAYFSCNIYPSAGMACEFELFLKTVGKPPSFRIPAKVVRVDTNGVGIVFGVDMKGIEHFLNMPPADSSSEDKRQKDEG